MNMNESDFEKELRALRPAPPAAALEEKIAAELRVAQTLVVAPSRAVSVPAVGIVTRRGNPWFGLLRGLGWAAAGAAAAVLVLTMREPSAAPEKNALVADVALSEEPDASSEEFIEAADDGVVFDADAAPQRQMRLTYFERHTWTNPATGAVIEFEIPREDIVWMPVAMQ
jgi:hypothetical protein